MGTPLFNQHEGLVGRDGGPYLDEEERREAETRRARIENREPDYDNAPATAGTPLVPAEYLANNVGVNSAPSKLTGGTSADFVKDSLLALKDTEGFPTPVSEIPDPPADTTSEEPVVSEGSGEPPVPEEPAVPEENPNNENLF